jgi:hypothetical protein
MNNQVKDIVKAPSHEIDNRKLKDHDSKNQILLIITNRLLSRKIRG